MLSKIKNENGIVYYYCTNQVLLSILKNREIWLTDIRSMNDAAEEQSIYLFYFKLLANLVNTNSHFQDLWGKFFEFIYSMNGEMWKSFVLPGGTYPKFAICFSKDSDSVSQWISYANNGYGFAIGFDENIINSLCYEFNEFKYSKITYLNSMTIDKNVLEFIEIIDKKIKNISTESIFEELLKFIKSKHKLNSYFYKSFHYSNERESRLVWNGEEKLEKRPILSKNEWEIDKHNYTISNEKIRGYLALKFKSSDFIKEIVIGPKNNNAYLEILELLHEFGFESVNINISTSQYR